MKKTILAALVSLLSASVAVSPVAALGMTFDDLETVQGLEFVRFGGIRAPSITPRAVPSLPRTSVPTVRQGTSAGARPAHVAPQPRAAVPVHQPSHLLRIILIAYVVLVIIEGVEHDHKKALADQHKAIMNRQVSETLQSESAKAIIERLLSPESLLPAADTFEAHALGESDESGAACVVAQGDLLQVRKAVGDGFRMTLLNRNEAANAESRCETGASILVAGPTAKDMAMAFRNHIIEKAKQRDEQEGAGK